MPRLERDESRDRWYLTTHDGPRYDWYRRPDKVYDAPAGSRLQRLIGGFLDWWHGWWG
jgi:hypothetical protein